MVSPFFKSPSKPATAESKPDGYGEELLYANWNPAIGVLAEAGFEPAQASSLALPEDLSELDVHDLLARIYALAARI